MLQVCYFSSCYELNSAIISLSILVWDPRQSLAAKELQKTARPLQGRSQVATAACADVQDTLACDMSPVAKAWMENPPIEIPIGDSKKPPPLGKRHASAGSTLILGDESKAESEPPLVDAPQSSGSDGATSGTQVVADAGDKSPQKIEGNGEQSKLETGDGMEDLFHANGVITRQQQMEEKDKLASEQRGNKEDPDETKPKQHMTKEEKKEAAKQRKAEVKAKAKAKAAAAKAKAKAKLIEKKKKELAKKVAAKAKAEEKKAKVGAVGVSASNPKHRLRQDLRKTMRNKQQKPMAILVMISPWKWKWH